MAIFNSYVCLPEGVPIYPNRSQSIPISGDGSSYLLLPNMTGGINIQLTIYEKPSIIWRIPIHGGTPNQQNHLFSHGFSIYKPSSHSGTTVGKPPWIQFSWKPSIFQRWRSVRQIRLVQLVLLGLLAFSSALGQAAARSVAERPLGSRGSRGKMEMDGNGI